MIGGSARSTSRSPREPNRAQTGPLGITMVFAIMLVGAITVVVFGAAAISDAQDTLSTNRAEKVMTELDSEVALVALGRTDSQQVAFARTSGDRFSVENHSGWLRVNVTNTTNANPPTTLVNETLGSVVYDNGDTSIVYQGGGVWRRDGDRAVMVSPPEFHYRNATLTLPLVTVRGSSALGSEASIEKNGTSDRVYPDPAKDRLNPLKNSEVKVTVRSEYYRAWGRYFETRTQGSVTYDDANQTATIRLEVPASNPPVQGGIVSGAPGSTLTVHNHATADSYNSSNGDYASTVGQNTRIITAGDVHIANHAMLEGSLESGKSVSIKNHGEITGNVRYGDGIGGNGYPGGIHGWDAQNASVSAPDSVETMIDSKREALSSSNDNADPGVDVDESANELENCGSTCTLTAGSYYLDEIDLSSGETLALDTTGGKVNVVVDGDVDIGGRIEVDDAGRANVFVEGDVDNGGNVDIANDRAPRFWLYMNPDKKFTFSNHARFEGVIYGPGSGPNPGATIEVANHAGIWGGMVGDVTFVSNHYEIHYDEALANTESVQSFTDIPALTYLHVTTNRVNVTG